MWMFILCLCIMWLLKSQSVVNRSCHRGAQIIHYYYQLFNSGHIFPTFSLLLSSVMIDWKCPSGLEAWVSVKIILYLATLVQTFWTYGHTVTSSVQQRLQTRTILSWWFITIQADTQRKSYVIMTSKPRGDVVLTSQWRFHCAMCSLGYIICSWLPFRRRQFQTHFHEWKCCISIQILLRFVPKGPINYKLALVQVMAWRLAGNKQLPEPMLVLFTDAYMRH